MIAFKLKEKVEKILRSAEMVFGKFASHPFAQETMAKMMNIKASLTTKK